MASCSRCEMKYGITCTDENALWKFKRRAVTMNGKLALEMTEPISQCQVLVGRSSPEAVAGKILEDIKKVQG